MIDFLAKLFSTDGFPARWYCGQWSSVHGWTHILSDVAIFGAYAAIPAGLAFFVRNRKDVPFTPLFWMFVAFILSCGVGHLIEATIFWHPWYRLSGAVKVTTALVSWATVIGLIRMMPKALSLPGVAKLNRELAREVEDRKRTEANLRESEGRFRQLTESLPQLVWTCGTDGQCDYLGPQWIEYTGVSENVQLGFGWLQQLHPEDREPTIEAWKRAVETNAAFDVEFRIRRADGVYRWFKTRAVLLRDSGGKPVKWLGTNTDIDDRRHVEAVQREADRLALTSKYKSEFVANMSHELRTPLNGIIGFSEFLIDQKPGKLNPKQQEYLNDILNSSNHLLQLINDVLDLAKVEAGRMELNPETFPLGKAIDEVCAVAKAIAQKKRIALKTQIAPDLGAVTLDQQKFKQIIYNLISNAVKFTDEGGQVEIIASHAGPSRFRVAVKDTGIGIKPEDMQRLFKEFEQLEAGTARRFEGTGLGLALTKKIVELQAGGIDVESEPGRGSTFAVTLPLSTEGKRP